MFGTVQGPQSTSLSQPFPVNELIVSSVYDNISTKLKFQSFEIPSEVETGMGGVLRPLFKSGPFGLINQLIKLK